MDVAYREVRDRVERARSRFPDDIDRVYIRKDDASGIPVYVLGVAVDPAVADTYDLIQNEIVLPLDPRGRRGLGRGPTAWWRRRS